MDSQENFEHGYNKFGYIIEIKITGIVSRKPYNLTGNKVVKLYLKHYLSWKLKRYLCY